nr:hypothetical protein [uncultured Desulfobulbus sp.]
MGRDTDFFRDLLHTPGVSNLDRLDDKVVEGDGGGHLDGLFTDLFVQQGVCRIGKECANQADEKDQSTGHQ